MGPHKDDILAFMTCVEIALMRKGNTKYNLVTAKLDSLYGCELIDCFEHPEFLKTVLKEVYKDDYKSILAEIKLELMVIVDLEEAQAKFFKIMEG